MVGIRRLMVVSGLAVVLGGNLSAAETAPLVAGADWFPWEPTWTGRPSAWGMEDWLRRAAAGRAGIRAEGDRFVGADGRVLRFWGVNLAYGQSAPAKADAEFTAARFARYGVNAVRMHKFTGAGWEGIGDENLSVRLKPEGLDRLDYFAAQLGRRGIVYGWSPTFQHRLRPGDRSRVAGFDELMAQGGNTLGLIHWAEDVQDLVIEMVVGLLKHKNPYTGKTYAEDPSLSFVEFQNEDDIFFYTTADALSQFPTYRKQLEDRFRQWLKDRYPTPEALKAVWGGSVSIEGNPWFYGTDNLAKQSGSARTRLTDTAAFLHETENRFYARFLKAVRDTGYQGPVTSSNWQAPAALPHYLNLASDARVGFIDRHEYFGGRLHDTLLGTPGAGFLAAGLQQVEGRPFVLSEWITVYPSLYSAEGPLLVGAWGLGLQGWDGSYQFQSTSDRPRALVGDLPWGIWNADTPAQLGTYPAVARMVLRGDVSPGPGAVRRIGSGDLATGRFPRGTEVPAEALARDRLGIGFTNAADAPAASGTPATGPGEIVSVTGQLRWDPAARVARVDTPGTQGYVGFASGRSLAFTDLSLRPRTDYALVLATALGQTGTLATDHQVLVTLVARNANTGMRVSAADDKTVVDNGTAPVLVEPVRATLTFTTRKPVEVRVLDQDGAPTPRTLTLVGGDTVDLDTGRDKTLYYLVSY